MIGSRYQDFWSKIYHLATLALRPIYLSQRIPGDNLVEASIGRRSRVENEGAVAVSRVDDLEPMERTPPLYKTVHR
jgi:hypothetical protein